MYASFQQCNPKGIKEQWSFYHNTLKIRQRRKMSWVVSASIWLLKSKACNPALVTNWRMVFKISPLVASVLSYSSIISMFSVTNPATAQSPTFLNHWSTTAPWHHLGVVWLPDKMYHQRIINHSTQSLTGCSCFWLLCILMHIQTLNRKYWYISILTVYDPFTKISKSWLLG